MIMSDTVRRFPNLHTIMSFSAANGDEDELHRVVSSGSGNTRFYISSAGNRSSATTPSRPERSITCSLYYLFNYWSDYGCCFTHHQGKWSPGTTICRQGGSSSRYGLGGKHNINKAKREACCVDNTEWLTLSVKWTLSLSLTVLVIQ